MHMYGMAMYDVLCMHVWRLYVHDVRMYVCVAYVCTYVCMCSVCMHVCMYVCMHVCMHVYVCMYCVDSLGIQEVLRHACQSIYRNRSAIAKQRRNCVRYVDRYIPPSQEPSAGPSIHRSSTRLQSNCGFPVRELTSLWSSHIHRENSVREEVKGG